MCLTLNFLFLDAICSFVFFRRDEDFQDSFEL
jgi:hypothetical protein